MGVTKGSEVHQLDHINVGERRKRDSMPVNKQSGSRMRVTEVEEFVRNPPPGFSVETLGSGYRVLCNEEKSLVLIDDFQSCGKKIVFHKSLGR